MPDSEVLSLTCKFQDPQVLFLLFCWNNLRSQLDNMCTAGPEHPRPLHNRGSGSSTEPQFFQHSSALCFCHFSHKLSNRSTSHYFHYFWVFFFLFLFNLLASDFFLPIAFYLSTDHTLTIGIGFHIYSLYAQADSICFFTIKDNFEKINEFLMLKYTVIKLISHE